MALKGEFSSHSVVEEKPEEMMDEDKVPSVIKNQFMPKEGHPLQSNW